MAIPNLTEESIKRAIDFMEKNGIPFHNESMQYDLVLDGKKYPPKYVVSLANHFQNGTEISVDDFNSVQAVDFLKKRGYTIETKQPKYALTITADEVVSTDARFTMDNISTGDNYKPLETYFVNAEGVETRRNYAKGERRNSNQTLPKLACQLFERQLVKMSKDEKDAFPVCEYNSESELITGIYSGVEEFRQHRSSIGYLVYSYADDRQFVIYCWNIFSTILFVQECLKRFGNPGDKFVLLYRDKTEKELGEKKTDVSPVDKTEKPGEHKFNGYRNAYSDLLIESKNIIFRGAPGTGKSYLAKEIATDIVSDGYYDDYTQLSEEQKSQIEFVQFHPSYDYTDFVEGLRPRVKEDGTMGFELKDGVFKRFVDRARKNYENSQKAEKDIENEASAQGAITDFFTGVELGNDSFKTINGNTFYITSVDDQHVYISIPGNAAVNSLCLNVGNIRRMLESGENFDKIKDVTAFFSKTFATQAYSYEFALYKEIKKKVSTSKIKGQKERLKKFIFIIDEINRGEISKIFGELFFSIDPGYRGPAGSVATQYANLHENEADKFYIPDNVYIIGTMNDIDRSVDSFDFAMRRRFRFIEIKADARVEMLDLLGEDLKAEAMEKMSALNKEIAATEGLNINYQIGASYFLKLKSIGFDQLWTDYLFPLLQEYVRGMYDENGILERYAKAYGYEPVEEGSADGTVEN